MTPFFLLSANIPCFPKRCKKILLAIIILWIPAFSFGQNNTATVKNLVFEGGGIRGLAYAGALIELKNKKFLDSIERVAGTSAGAIAATLFSVGYSPEEILKLIYDLKIKSFADGKWIFIGGTKRLVRNFGWYRGEKFNKWISKLIKAKTGKEDITFEELFILARKNNSYKDLYLTGTNLSKQQSVILCRETFPKMQVRTAVSISMTIPFYFKAVIIDDRGFVCSKKELHKGNVMVDGGILANYPIHIFDYQKYIDHSNDSTSIVNPETLGLRLDTEKQIEYDKQCKGLEPVEIRKIKDFTQAFYNIVLENLNRNNLTKDDWKRTISISTGSVGPKIKRLSDDNKSLLIANGKKGVMEYFGDK